MSSVDMLEDLGHDVLEAHSGKQALDYLRDGRSIDLLITDFAMPGMTGAQLIETVRGLRPDLPILLATGYAELPDGQLGDVPRIGKPFTQSQLAGEVAKLLNGAAH
jgi:CheY-like chemotaxis protein